MDTSFNRRVDDLLALVESGASNQADVAHFVDQATTDIELGVVTFLIGAGSLREAEQVLTAASARPMDTSHRELLAARWLQLARSWRRSRDAEREEFALNRSIEFGAGAEARTALAQRLQRQGRVTEAIAQLREVIQAEPGNLQARVSRAELEARDQDATAAVATYLELVDAVPSRTTWLLVAERLLELAPALPEIDPQRSVRIALLGNATLDHLASYLTVDAFRAGLRPTVYQPGYDQYQQEILNHASGLYAFDPQVTVLAIHATRLLPRIHAYPFDLSVEARRRELDEGLQSVQHLLDQLTTHSAAMVLVHNLVSPQHPALGLLDGRDNFGQRDAFAEFNRRLAELARARYRGVYVIDEDGVQARNGKATATDPRLWLTARMPWGDAALRGLCREYLRHIRAQRGMTRKCVVVDLDNTLWGGVIGEDGLAGIQLGSEAPGNAFVALQRELEILWRRGILLAVCSKNNPDDAWQALDHHPEMVLKRSHFAAARINWQPKPTNIREIARELNIGLDSLVFLDDNPVERAAVRAELPQVFTPELPSDPSLYRSALLDLADVFDSLSLTREDRERNKLYAEQRARSEAQAALSERGGSLEDYLATMDIVVEIESANDLTLPRIAQLTGKTNQFNLTTKRYTDAQLADQLARGWRVYGARVLDRFGDNGVTGVVIATPENDRTWSIDTLLLSCRVMGRGIETALLALVADEARRAGASVLRAEYRPTAKNEVVRNLYASHGFRLVDQTADGQTRWERDLVDTIATPAWLTVRTPAAV